MIKSKVYSYCLILSTVILGTNATSASAQNTQSPQAIAAKTFINSVNRAEQAHYFESQKFTNNLQDLQLTPPDESYKYQLKIVNQQNLVQTIATPTKSSGFKTFIGALSFNNGNFNSILCRSEKYAQVNAGQIKLVEDRLQCPTGFKITFHQVQQEAISSIGGMNRAQQAYLVETQNYAENQDELGYIPSNTYFNYKIELLKNGELAQASATPRFDNLKSYLSGIFFSKNTNNFKSIVCVSNKPTTNITQSIKLVDNKLSCPTDFKITALNLAQEAINSIGGINRAQQAYFFETQNFAKNIDLLEFSPSNNYFNYIIDIVENGKLAQIKATPKPNNLQSYIGGIFFENKTGAFQSIVCASEQPSKDISQLIKLVDDKLFCPTGFKIYSPETE
jgi:Type IV pilin-like G and H, putative